MNLNFLIYRVTGKGHRELILGRSAQDKNMMDWFTGSWVFYRMPLVKFKGGHRGVEHLSIKCPMQKSEVAGKSSPGGSSLLSRKHRWKKQGDQRKLTSLTLRKMRAHREWHVWGEGGACRAARRGAPPPRPAATGAARGAAKGHMID